MSNSLRRLMATLARRRSPSADEAELRGRATLVLDAFEQVWPGPMWPRMRARVAAAEDLAGLREISRELREMQASMPAAAARDLERALRARFGPDPERARDLAVIARALRRGRIRSADEHRIVRSYAATIADDPDADPDTEAEVAALDTLLRGYPAPAAHAPGGRGRRRPVVVTLLTLLTLGAAAAWNDAWPLRDALGPCENSVVQVVIDPVGARRAVVFTRDCGGAEYQSTMVTVRSLLGGILLAGPGNAFRATWDRGRADTSPLAGAPPVVVEWLAPDRVRVTVDDRSRSWHADGRVGGVAVEERKAPPRSPWR